jgi:two-component system, chemotaxis family, chemotaxis protein CheY
MARVLLVDDEPDALMVLAGIIEAGGHTACFGPPDGELWQLLAETHFDLLLVSHDMQSMDGPEIANWFRLHRPGVPTVALASEPTRAPPGFAAVVAKPPQRVAVLVALGQALGAAPR